jgi:hypothetical protein
MRGPSHHGHVIDEGPLHHDLDDFFGSWLQDPTVDAALEEQRQVDLRDWD